MEILNEIVDIDFEYEKILEWATLHKGLKIWWEDRSWFFSWEYGFISFDGIKPKEEDKARKATALFIYLWKNKNISASLAERLAASYVLMYTIN